MDVASLVLRLATPAGSAAAAESAAELGPAQPARFWRTAHRVERLSRLAICGHASSYGASRTANVALGAERSGEGLRAEVRWFTRAKLGTAGGLPDMA